MSAANPRRATVCIRSLRSRQFEVTASCSGTRLCACVKSEWIVVLDSARGDESARAAARDHKKFSRPHRVARPYPHHSLRLLFQPSRRDRSRRPRRTALRMDRPRHGRERRLDHSPPVRPALVREATSLLLGCRRQLQTLRRDRSRSPPSQCDCRSDGHAGTRRGLPGEFTAWKPRAGCSCYSQQRSE